MIRTTSCFLLSAALLALLAGCAAPEAPPPEASATANIDRYELIGIYAMVQELLREQYLDPGAVDYDALTTGALKGMLRSLDYYSAYDTPEEFSRVRRELSGEQIGIGTVVAKENQGFLRIVATLPDTPAAAAGLRAGDEIAAIDGVGTADISVEECRKLMRGDVGSPVRLSYFRDGDYDTPRHAELVRKSFHRNSVPNGHARMLTAEIAYIPIESFTETTAMELDAALAQLAEASPRALILDLRNNPGGIIEGAVAVASRFLEPGLTVVSLEGRLQENNEILRSRGVERNFAGPMAVLINGYSASAAEIVAGALRDHDRAVIVGATSFGKGTVQRLFELPNGGAVRFTIARYFTPFLEGIDGIGVAPGIEVCLSPEHDRQLADQLLRPPGSGRIDDPQLERALAALQDQLTAL